jgi:hypothetical protein
MSRILFTGIALPLMLAVFDVKWWTASSRRCPRYCPLKRVVVRALTPGVPVQEDIVLVHLQAKSLGVAS